MKNQDQKNRGLYQILWNPFTYLLVQNLFGKRKFYRILVKDYLTVKEGGNILDIGCGVAQIVDFLPDNIVYTGFDINSSYINYAKKKYKNKVQLYDKKISDANTNDFNKYDYIISIAVVHHLNDKEAEDLFRLGFNLLKSNGTMITSDPTWNETDNFFAKLQTKNDRGNHIRYPNEYKAIAKKVFNKVDISVRKDLITLPQSGCIMCCKKSEKSIY